jgi:hypothetical protein
MRESSAVESLLGAPPSIADGNQSSRDHELLSRSEQPDSGGLPALSDLEG